MADIELILQPPDVIDLSIQEGSPFQLTFYPPRPIQLSIQTGSTTYNIENGLNVTGTAYEIDVAIVDQTAIVGIANPCHISNLTVDGNMLIDTATQINDDLTVLGNLEVDQTSTFNGATTVTAGQTFTADVGGDIQGSLPNPTVHRIKGIDIHNNPDDLDIFQYLSSNNKYHWVTFAEAGVAAATHYHAGSDITSGTVAFARLPTGTTSSTVAIGNHTHSGADITSGTVGFSYLPTGTGASQVAIGNHTHTMADITDLREQKIFVECECNAAGEFTTISANSGTNSFTGTGIDTTGGHYGILTSGTSTTNNAVAGIGSGDTTTATIFGTFKVETTAIVMIPALSTSGERFFIESGWTDNRTGTPTDGVMISYSDGQNSSKFIGLCYNNNTLSTVDLGITVAANTWYNLKTVVNVNGSIDYYIDGVLKGSLAAGSAPTGSTRATALSHTIRKTVGTTARTLYIDYINYVVWCSR